MNPSEDLPDEIEDAILEVIDRDAADRDAAARRFAARHPAHVVDLDRALAELRHLTEQEHRSAERLARLRDSHGLGERYEFLDEVDRGGMGVIDRVRDPDLDRELARKTALAEPGPDGEPARIDEALLERFLDEALITGQLEHPNIVPVHDLGIDAAGRPWFSMQLVKGETAEQLFRSAHHGQVELARALEVLLKVCDAVGYAHSRGVVHRDLKPSNVMVGTFGEVYVMDWGLAKVVGTPDRHDLRIRPARQGDPLVTMDGTVLGTPCFMAPEQAFGDVEQVGPAADIYALGAMLYELLTGARPYFDRTVRPTQARLLQALRDGPPTPVHRLARRAPRALAAIQRRAMARDPDQRYPDIGALATDLRAFLEARVVQAHRTGPAAELVAFLRRSPALAASVLLLVLLLAGGTTGFALREAYHEAQLRSGIERINEQLAQARDESQRRATELEDANTLGAAARLRERDPWRALRLLARGVLDDSPLRSRALQDANDVVADLPTGWRLRAGSQLHPGYPYALDFSPDGLQLLVGYEGAGTWQASASDLTPVRRYPDLQLELFLHRTTLADGSGFVALRGDEVRLASLESAAATATVALRHDAEVGAIAVAPDSRRLATFRWDRRDLWLWDLDAASGTGRPAVTLPTTGTVTDFAGFGAAGRLLAALCSPDLEVHDLGRPDARVFRVAPPVGEEFYGLRIADALARLAWFDTTHRLHFLDLDSDTPAVQILDSSETPGEELAFDAAGGLLASLSADGTLRVFELGERPLRIGALALGASSRDVRFAGDSIALASADGSRGQVVVTGPRGRRIARLRSHEAPVRRIAYSEATGRLASCAEDGSVCIWEPDRSMLVRVPTSLRTTAAAWLPGRRAVVLCDAAEGRLEIRDAADDRPTASWRLPDGARPRTVDLSASGHQLAVTTDDHTLYLLDPRRPDRPPLRARDEALAAAFDGETLQILRPDGAVYERRPDGSRRQIAAVDRVAERELLHVDSRGFVNVLDDRVLTTTWRAPQSERLLRTLDPQRNLSRERPAAAAGDGPRRFATLTNEGLLVRDVDRDSAWTWSASSGRSLEELALSPDGSRVAVADTAGTVFVLPTASPPATDGQVLRLRCEGRIRGLCFAPDGRRLLTFDATSATRTWALDWPVLRADLLANRPGPAPTRGR